MLCLAIWLPATQHCQLEKLPGLSFLQCAGDSGEQSCQGDSCEVVERGVYKAPDAGDVTAVFVAILLPAVAALIAETAEAGSSVPPVCEVSVSLAQSWSSYSAVAIPIRGPSISS
jgi:hypothetical protein